MTVGSGVIVRRGGAYALALATVSAGCGTSQAPGITPPEDLSNAPPSFASPRATTDHNVPYVYQVRVTDPDGDDVTVSAERVPGWTTFDADRLVLSGTAGWDNLGSFTVALRATDGRDTARQAFQLTVGVGPIDCGQSFGNPAQSDYVLPFTVGDTSRLIQGYCRAFGGHVGYYAYDFALPFGDSVRAAREGVVIFTRGSKPDSTGISGDENLVYVEHPDGTIGRYVHFTQNGVLVTVGQNVSAGDVLGLNGMSGGTTSPHVHFDVFRNGDWNSVTFDIGRRYALPINFRNASGPLDARGGLVEGADYTALP